jgi:hypothetical protein
VRIVHARVTFLIFAAPCMILWGESVFSKTAYVLNCLMRLDVTRIHECSA